MRRGRYDAVVHDGAGGQTELLTSYLILCRSACLRIHATSVCRNIPGEVIVAFEPYTDSNAQQSRLSVIELFNSFEQTGNQCPFSRVLFLSCSRSVKWWRSRGLGWR
jgi:hypothetical protein